MITCNVLQEVQYRMCDVDMKYYSEYTRAFEFLVALEAAFCSTV